MKYNTKLLSIFTAFIFYFLVATVTPVYAQSAAASGSGTTEAMACQQAKMLAQQYCGGVVESFGNCSSCRMQIINGYEQWSCQVDARCGQRSGGVVKPEY